MDKKKVSIIAIVLAVFLALIVIIIVVSSNSSEPSKKETGEENTGSTAKIQGGTTYDSDDTDDEYEKMLEEERQQDDLDQKELAKMLAKKEKKEKEREKKEIEYAKDLAEAKTAQERAEISKSLDSVNKLKDKVLKENGHNVRVNDFGIKTLDNGENGRGHVASNKPKGDGIVNGREPFYNKYIEQADDKVVNKKTPLTEVLKKHFANDKYLVVNVEPETKGNLLASVYIPKKDSHEFVMSAANVSGTAKTEKLSDKVTVNYYSIQEDFLDKHTDKTYSILKDFDIPLSKGEFKQLYKNYKNNKLVPINDVYISYDGKGVTLEW